MIKERVYGYIESNFYLYLYGLFIIIMLSINYYSYKLGPDSAVLNNIFYNTIYGKAGYCSVEGMNHLSMHFSPLIYIFLPLYLVTQKYTLYLVMFASFFLSVWGIFLISRYIFRDNKISFLIGLTFLFYAPVTHNLVWDFHRIIIALPIFIFSFYLLKKDKIIQSMLLFSLGFLVQEDIFLLGIFFGLYIFFFCKKKEGLYFSLITILGFVTVTKIIMPSFSESVQHPLWVRYAYLGANYKEVFLGFFKNPLVYLFPPFYSRKLLSLLAIFLPLLFLPLLRPAILFIPVINIIYSYLSSIPQIDYADHYAIPIMVYVFLAYIFSIRYINEKFKNKKIIIKIAISVLIVNCIFTIISFYVRGEIERLKPLSNKNIYIEATHLIPEKASIFTHPVACFFVSDRSKLFCMKDVFSEESVNNKSSEYILINFRYVYFHFTNYNELDKMHASLKELMFNQNYAPIFFKEDVLLLKKRKFPFERRIYCNALKGYDVGKYKNYNYLSIVPKWVKFLATKV